MSLTPFFTPPLITELWIALFVLVGSALLTAGLRVYGMKRLLDQPNARSSHTRPVPRGGGLAIVMSFLAAIGVLFALAPAASEPSVHALFVVLLAAGAAVAAVGYWDDHVPVRARWRLAVHLSAAAFAVALIGPVRIIPLGFTTLELPTWLGVLLSVLALTWLLNLYNFMDGIDALAGLEAVSVALVVAGLAIWHAAATPGLTALAAASAGFLLWNWPPARLFMGDVGSGFLGFVLGVYALHSVQAAAHWLWVWIIVLAVFWTDATVTLLRRAVARQPLYAAHRTHAYQHLARRLNAHRPVSLGALALNLFYLAPLAACAAQFPQWSALIALTACAPLAAVAYGCHAGQPEVVPPASTTAPLTSS